MFNIEKVKDRIDKLYEGSKVSLWNDYCEANNYYDDMIEYNDIDELLYGCTPSEVLDRIDKNYSQYDEYCSWDGYGELCSFNDIDDSDFDIDVLASWIYDNEDACGYLDEDDITDHFDACNFVDEYFNDDDVENFIADNDLNVDVDEDVDPYDAVINYLADLDDDVEEIVSSLSGLGWTFDIEERVLQYFN